MSGIVGSSHNIRGSGLVAKLGTDGQVFTSAGAGVKQTFEDAAGGGKILQMVQTLVTTTSAYNSSSFAALSGYQVAITPTKASSKIQVVVSLGIAGRDSRTGWKVARDVEGGGYSYLANIGTGSMGQRIAIWGSTTYSAEPSGATTTVFIDSPSYTLTDVLTYQFHPANSGGEMYFNRDTSDDDQAYRHRSASTMQVWELSA